MARDEAGKRLLQRTTATWFGVVFGGSLGYAVVRYHLAGDVEWHHFPVFILNKATSFAAVIFIACSYLVGKVIHWHDHDKGLRLIVIKFCGLMGFSLAGIHALLSLSILRPAYFATYFDAVGRLTLSGELGVLFGVVSLLCLMSPAISALPMMPKALGGRRWKRAQRMGYLALLIVSLHLAALGLKGWLAPAGWHAGLPPISLLAFTVAVVPLVVRHRLVTRYRKRSAAGQGDPDNPSRPRDEPER